MTLFIELCRFTHLPNGRLCKDNSYVDIPEILDITDYCDTSMRTEQSSNTYKYRLKGISNHMGGMGGGHYTAIVCSRSCTWSFSAFHTHSP